MLHPPFTKTKKLNTTDSRNRNSSADNNVDDVLHGCPLGTREATLIFQQVQGHKECRGECEDDDEMMVDVHGGVHKRTTFYYKISVLEIQLT